MYRDWMSKWTRVCHHILNPDAVAITRTNSTRSDSMPVKPEPRLIVRHCSPIPHPHLVPSRPATTLFHTTPTHPRARNLTQRPLGSKRHLPVRLVAHALLHPRRQAAQAGDELHAAREDDLCALRGEELALNGVDDRLWLEDKGLEARLGGEVGYQWGADPVGVDDAVGGC